MTGWRAGIVFFLATFSFMLSGVAFAGWTEPVRISEPGGGYYPQILAQ